MVWFKVWLANTITLQSKHSKYVKRPDILWAPQMSVQNVTLMHPIFQISVWTKVMHQPTDRSCHQQSHADSVAKNLSLQNNHLNWLK